ncbi:GNAT family N-acetyltransferase [Nostoc sp. CHAB 5834]|nr:GNAT family N-acetyltransferase [Nostoc sp. CHAB 5834]
MEIKIRHVEPDDYKEIQKIYAQTKTVWGTLQLPFPSVEMWRKRLTEKSNNLYSLVACADNEIVGALDIWIDSHSPRRKHVGGVGIAVHDEWQSQGIGTLLMDAGIELADKWLNLVRLELTVYVDNEPAINLYQKFGFKVEGKLEKYAFREGSYVDVYSMARIHLPQIVTIESL